MTCRWIERVDCVIASTSQSSQTHNSCPCSAIKMRTRDGSASAFAVRTISRTRTSYRYIPICQPRKSSRSKDSPLSLCFPDSAQTTALQSFLRLIFWTSSLADGLVVWERGEISAEVCLLDNRDGPCFAVLALSQPFLILLLEVCCWLRQKSTRTFGAGFGWRASRAVSVASALRVRAAPLRLLAPHDPQSIASCGRL